MACPKRVFDSGPQSKKICGTGVVSLQQLICNIKSNTCCSKATEILGWFILADDSDSDPGFLTL